MELDISKCALFFDIDGTLTDPRDGHIPNSIPEIFEKVRAMGAKIFISSGRVRHIMFNIEKLAPYIDGYITANGAAIYIDDKLEKVLTLKPEIAKLLLLDAKKHDYCLVIDTLYHFTVFNPKPAVGFDFISELKDHGIDTTLAYEKIEHEPLLQLTPFISDEHEKQLMSKLDNCISARWHPEFTDITVKGADKGSGVKYICERFGIDINNTVAFGDGGNDLPMLKTAAIGVAMGNAFDEVKAQADLVTDNSWDDGVANAIKKIFKL